MPFYKTTVTYTVVAEKIIEADDKEAAECYAWATAAKDFEPSEIMEDTLELQEVERV